MKALVYHGPGLRSWEEKPDPIIQEPSDVIVRIDSATICGTDLHILKGDRNVTITTGLVDTFTTPRLLKLIVEGRLDATPFATHRFPLEETMAAYDTFAAAAETGALKVVLEAGRVTQDQAKKEVAPVGSDA
jgi:threonine dehydrogenase-like Zn-dependent dehydrogenase